MYLKTFTTGIFKTNGYLISDENSNESIIVDTPPDFYEPVSKEIEKNNFNVKYIISTHGHIDHIADNHILKKEFDAKIFLHENDLFWLNPPEEITNALPFELIPFTPDDYLKEGDVFRIGKYSFKTIHTPGHTQGGICLYEESERILFTGDTIFQDTIGRTDLPGGSTKVLIDSIKNKILTLPDDVRIYPGHGEPTTVGAEKKYNPFL